MRHLSYRPVKLLDAPKLGNGPTVASSSWTLCDEIQALHAHQIHYLRITCGHLSRHDTPVQFLYDELYPKYPTVPKVIHIGSDAGWNSGW